MLLIFIGKVNLAMGIWRIFNFNNVNLPLPLDPCIERWWKLMRDMLLSFLLGLLFLKGFTEGLRRECGKLLIGERYSSCARFESFWNSFSDYCFRMNSYTRMLIGPNGNPTTLATTMRRSRFRDGGSSDSRLPSALLLELRLGLLLPHHMLNFLY